MMQNNRQHEVINLSFSEWMKSTPETSIQLLSSKPTAKPNEHRDEFLKTFHRLSFNMHRPIEIWNDFVLMTACALSNSLDKEHFEKREQRYLQIIGKYSKQEQELFSELLAHLVMALDLEPEQDFLGEIYMKLNLGSKVLQQVFTPYNVCKMMAAMIMGNVTQQVEDRGYITINDPCCGGGATLIAGVHEVKNQLEKVNLNYQNHVLVIAQDIDETAALMCYIQLSLLGVAAFIKVGNSLTDPITIGDSTEDYWFTPMYFSNVWTMRRLLQSMKPNSMTVK